MVVRSDDPNVRWVMKQNLTKKRLTKAGADWSPPGDRSWTTLPEIAEATALDRSVSQA
jgi:hypothetical protein